MKEYLLALLAEQFIPIIITVVLGLIGSVAVSVKLTIRYAGTAFIKVADSLEDGKIDKAEWKAIKPLIWKIITPWRKTPKVVKKE